MRYCIALFNLEKFYFGDWQFEIEIAIIKTANH